MAPQQSRGGTFEVGQVAAGNELFALKPATSAGGAGHPGSPSGSKEAWEGRGDKHEGKY